MRTTTQIGPALRRSLLLLAVLWSIAAAADPVRIGGTGSGSALMARLAQEYQRSDHGAHVNVILPPLGSGGGLRALSAGKLDIAVTGRALKPDEAAMPGLGKEFEYAKTPFVLASSVRKPGDLSLPKLAQLYTGQVVRWPDGSPIRLVLRTKSESDTALLRSLSPQMNAAVDAAYARPGMVFADNDIDTVDLLAKTPGSLGPTTLGMLRIDGRSLSPLTVDGTEPTLKNMSDGNYRWAKSIYLVTAAAPSPGARKFFAFLHSEPARRLLAELDYLIVSPWPPASSAY